MNIALFKRPERIFLFFSLIFGFILIFFTPPLLSADEPAHFLRAYSLSEGKFTSVVIDNQAGNYAPYAFKEFENIWEPMFYNTDVKTNFLQIKKSRSIVIDKQKLFFANQCYQSLYSPLAYLPQTIGISIAKHFTQSVYWILMTAKVFLLAFYIILGYFSIKSLPLFKWLLFLILLAPTALSLGCSVSADGVIIPLSIFYLAKIFQFSFREKVLIEKQEIIGLCLLSIFLALVKQSFFISLFVFFIPHEKFGGKYWIKILIILLPGFLFAIAWSICSSGWFVPLNNSNPILQVQFILSHPIIYLLTILKTIKMCTVMWIYSIICVLGWNSLFLFPVVYLLYFVAVCLNTIYKEISYKVNFLQMAVLVSVFILNFIFICTEIYISWTQPYFTKFINIVQGRYLIPIIPFLLCFIGFLFISPKRRTALLDCFTVAVVLVAYLNLFLSMFIVYYF